MRGLKLKDEYDFEISRLSHLLQMRGLKQKADNLCHKEVLVASFTDAWIETLPSKGIQ